MKFPYSDKVLEHFKNPHNVGEIEDPDGKATVGSPACGDMVSVYIKVNADSKKIEDIKFESYGCASNIATGSIITDMAAGKTLDEAKEITWKQAAEELDGLPPVKVHCSVLAVDALRSAIQNYEERHGLVKEKIPTSVEEVKKRLRHVMNPLKGLDIVKTEIVTDISLTEGTVKIKIDLPSDHQFAANIKDEILERIEPLWDINYIDIIFTE